MLKTFTIKQLGEIKKQNSKSVYIKWYMQSTQRILKQNMPPNFKYKTGNWIVARCKIGSNDKLVKILSATKIKPLKQMKPKQIDQWLNSLPNLDSFPDSDLIW